MNKLWLLAFFLLITCTVQLCKGKANPYQIVNATFVKVGSHPFGEKYVYYNKEIDHNYYLIKVKGNSYQAGVAYGSLMKNQIKQNIDNLWKYYYALAEQEFKFITKIPEQYQPLARTLAIKILKSLLVWNHYITKPYTPNRYPEQYAGVSAGSGIAQKKIIQINMIPEYTRAGCSILGAWGNATKNGDLIQLRALDWDVNNPMNKFPTLIVYDLEQKGSKPFVNLAWAGFVGSITGFSETVGVSEKVRKQNPVKQNQTRLGKPWVYAVRDLLQFTDTIDGALASLQKTKRTCSIYLGIGSSKNNTFRLIEYSHKQFKTYDDSNFTFTPTHVQKQGLVFMPYNDNENTCFNDHLVESYGSITAQWMVNILAPQHGTGNTQMAAFNFRTKQLLFQISYNKKLAYERPMLRIQLADFLKK